MRFHAEQIVVQLQDFFTFENIKKQLMTIIQCKTFCLWKFLLCVFAFVM